MAKLLFSLDIQLFAEGDGAGTGGEGGEGSGSSTAGASGTQSTAQIDYEQLADVISRRTSGTEDKVLQGYFRGSAASRPPRPFDSIKKVRSRSVTTR